MTVRKPEIVVELTRSSIDCESIWSNLSNVDAGAHNVFLGKTRRRTGEQVTKYLVYEAYDEMAKAELRKIAVDATERWSLLSLVIVHRLGRVGLDEASVAIGASAPHRKPVFEAVPWLLDELKKSVPIWKEEHWDSGDSQWVHS